MVSNSILARGFSGNSKPTLFRIKDVRVTSASFFFDQSIDCMPLCPEVKLNKEDKWNLKEKYSLEMAGNKKCYQLH